jgi:hypothetical protein
MRRVIASLLASIMLSMTVSGLACAGGHACHTGGMVGEMADAAPGSPHPYPCHSTQTSALQEREASHDSDSHSPLAAVPEAMISDASAIAGDCSNCPLCATLCIRSQVTVAQTPRDAWDVSSTLALPSLRPDNLLRPPQARV